MEQLVAQTEEIYKRKHVYRTEIFQLQDLYTVGRTGPVYGPYTGPEACNALTGPVTPYGTLTSYSVHQREGECERVADRAGGSVGAAEHRSTRWDVHQEPSRQEKRTVEEG